jgi:hypothetical protein
MLLEMAAALGLGLRAWSRSHGPIEAFGSETTGLRDYGASARRSAPQRGFPRGSEGTHRMHSARCR